MCVYDIRTTESALRTLEELTGVDPAKWEDGYQNRALYQFDDDLVEGIIKMDGHFPDSYESWRFVYSHITTSANCCKSILDNGILDLRETYSLLDSELRQFLDSKEIYIKLNDRVLEYRGKQYDISYGKCPSTFDNEAHARWLIGRKFYYDYNICGFLSISDNVPYLGNVHQRPEILFDIDNLLGLTLSQEWRRDHKPYEVVVEASGSEIEFDVDNVQSSDEITLTYLTKAYFSAIGGPSEEPLLLKRHVQVSPINIKRVKPLKCWELR